MTVLVEQALRESESRPLRVLRVPLHAGQVQVMNAIERYIFVIAGTGVGKTFLGPRWMYREVRRYLDEPVPSQKYLVFAPSYKLLEVAIAEYLRFFDVVWRGTWKVARLVYRLPNGAQIFFRSADNPRSMEGLHVRAAHGDEIGQESVSLRVWDTARRRLSLYEGRFLGTTTPYNLGWLKQNIVDPFRRGEAPDTRVIGMRSIDNPMYPRAEYEHAKATLPRATFRMFYDGEFERAAGLIFDIFDEARHVMKPFEIPFNWGRYAGQDFGLKHPTATVFGALDPRPYPNDVLYLYAEYRLPERPTSDHVSDIKRLAGGPLRKMWADPRSVQLIKDYKAAGLPIEKGAAGPGDVKATIQEVYTRLAENASDGGPRLRLFRSLLPGWLDEVERYEWAKDAAGNPTDKPVEYADDLMDCTRYLCGGIKTPVAADLPKSPMRDGARPIAAGILDRKF